MLTPEIRKQITELVRHWVVPAMGCTEPICVALATAKATEILGTTPAKVEALLSANILKNAMGVGIPGTGMVGLPIAIALGALIGKSAYGLEVIKDSNADAVEQGKKFIDEVEYPVVVKPDNGVGASHTYKLKNDDDLRNFLNEWASEYPEVPYIMEEFVPAEVNSYDAIINSKGEPIFEAGNVTPGSIMDIVNKRLDLAYYVAADMLNGTSTYARHYTEKERKVFETYLQSRIDLVEIANKDENFLRERILTMYANPVFNKQNALR